VERAVRWAGFDGLAFASFDGFTVTALRSAQYACMRWRAASRAAESHFGALSGAFALELGAEVFAFAALVSTFAICAPASARFVGTGSVGRFAFAVAVFAPVFAFTAGFFATLFFAFVVAFVVATYTSRRRGASSTDGGRIAPWMGWYFVDPAGFSAVALTT